ncbi:Nischarin [Acropora cervicornis]|uniref:Nischarin n=1 Tax=Acropora cervicornis TaxID=6130 RepID=A0AAD9R0V9_ACRCE|nr:Nischarin [Acropora cervicornis]
MKIRKVLVPATEQVDSYTVYYLEVHIREYSWFVSRRYREFYELHEKLVKRYGIDQSLIPPKRYFGMRQPEYVEKRRLGLETYIQTLLLQFDDNLPQEIQDFLESDKFLHCITRRLGMAAPTCASHIPHGEIGNLYDFLYQLRHLKICGAGTPVELSENISLKCNLCIFKSLKTLEIDSCELEPFEGFSSLQSSLKKLSVHNSVHLLKDVLIDDEIWNQGVLESVEVDGIASLNTKRNFRSWTALTEALLPELICLSLSHNCIEAIEHLEVYY